MVSRFLFLFVFSFSLLQAAAPRIVSYTSDDLKTHPTVYAIDEDAQNGMMYFSSAYRLLQYSGEKWESVYDAKAVSSHHDSKGNFYIGSENDFGVLKNGKYTSLAKNIPSIGRTQLFKQTLCFGKNTLFLSDDLLVWYDGVESKYFRAEVGESFSCLIGVNGALKVFTSKGRVGVVSTSGIDFTLMSFAVSVNKIVAFEKKFLILGTNALYWWDGDKSLQKINANVELSQVNSIAVLKNNLLALGTKRNGVLVLNTQSGVVETIDKAKGLVSNIINCLYTDKNGDLWVATDNGVSILKYGLPYQYINDNLGLEGMGYASIVFKGKVYLGSASGLYFYNNLDMNGAPQKIEGVNGFVHDLVSVNGQLLCANEYGAYVIDGNKATKITSGNSKVWSIRELPNHNLLMGTLDGLLLFNSSKEVIKVLGFTESCRKFEIQNNTVWMIHGNKGLYEIQLDKDFKNVVKWQNYNEQHHLEGNYFKDIFALKGSLMVAGYGGVFSINNKMELVKSVLFSKIAYDFHRLRNINEDELFIKVNQKPIILSLVNGYCQEKYNLLDMDYNVAGSAENITKLNDHTYLIGVEQGFTLFTPQNISALPSVFIREMKVNDGAFFHYNLPVFGNKEAITYYLVLKKSGENYSLDTTLSTLKEYSNLPAGEYAFEVSAFINNQRSEVVTMSFTIVAPWYLSTTAYIIYVLLLLMLAWLIYKIHQSKLKQVTTQLTTEHKVELSKVELQRQEDEMAFLALNYAQKKQVLNTINENIKKMMDTTIDENMLRNLKNLKQTINMDLEESDENKWEKFQVHLDNTQDNFFKKLKEKDPDLDESALLMCSYIKMGKSNKEISNLLNISVAAVAKRKYRMKKKWNLEEDDSLTELLKKL